MIYDISVKRILNLRGYQYEIQLLSTSGNVQQWPSCIEQEGNASVHHQPVPTQHETSGEMIFFETFEKLKTKATDLKYFQQTYLQMFRISWMKRVPWLGQTTEAARTLAPAFEARICFLKSLTTSGVQEKKTPTAKKSNEKGAWPAGLIQLYALGTQGSYLLKSDLRQQLNMLQSRSLLCYNWHILWRSQSEVPGKGRRSARPTSIQILPWPQCSAASNQVKPPMRNVRRKTFKNMETQGTGS